MKNIINFLNEDYELMLSVKSNIDGSDYDMDDFDDMVKEMYNLNELDELQYNELLTECDTFVVVKYKDADGNIIEL